jgi:hypothetical protein
MFLITELLGFSAGPKYIPITRAYSFLSGKIGQCSPRLPRFRLSEFLQTSRTAISPSRVPRTQENTHRMREHKILTGMGGVRIHDAVEGGVKSAHRSHISLIRRPMSFYDDLHESARLVTAVSPNSLIQNPFRTSQITNEIGNKFCGLQSTNHHSYF